MFLDFFIGIGADSMAKVLGVLTVVIGYIILMAAMFTK